MPWSGLRPLVGASFGCVFLREGDSDLLRVVAAHNWPQTYASLPQQHAGARRQRTHRPRGGRERQAVEVPDVFADPALEDWWDSARELGFASSVSLPLVLRRRTPSAR